MNELADVISSAIKGKAQTGSDYTAKVTRVEGSTAYVQITGSDIADTPVAMSVSAKAGDMVRVRVADGRAWITGNDTAPPANNAEVLQELERTNDRFTRRRAAEDGRYSQIEQAVDQIMLEVGNRMKADMSNRASRISITSGLIAFLTNTLKIDSTNFKLDENGNATFSGTIKGAKYVDNSHNFTMDIGSAEHASGSVTPAFKIGGYVNGNSANDYLDIEITLYKTSGASLPNFYIAGTIRNSPGAAEKASVSIGVDDTGIHFYGSWSSGAQRVHSSLPWGYNPS